MQLIPIDIDPAKNTAFSNNPDCIDILNIYPDFYKKIGYCLPWVGYFAVTNNELVGYGGYKSQPVNGKVEIAYGTVKRFEGQGIGTKLCCRLVELSLQTDPSIRIIARTLPENNASAQILKRNGFECLGIVHDEEDGDVWEWEYVKPQLQTQSAPQVKP